MQFFRPLRVRTHPWCFVATLTLLSLGLLLICNKRVFRPRLSSFSLVLYHHYHCATVLNAMSSAKYCRQSRPNPVCKIVAGWRMDQTPRRHSLCFWITNESLLEWWEQIEDFSNYDYLWWTAMMVPVEIRAVCFTTTKKGRIETIKIEKIEQERTWSKCLSTAWSRSYVEEPKHRSKIYSWDCGSTRKCLV